MNEETKEALRQLKERINTLEKEAEKLLEGISNTSDHVQISRLRREYKKTNELLTTNQDWFNYFGGTNE
jgi:prefoldin subunit 5